MLSCIGNPIRRRKNGSLVSSMVAVGVGVSSLRTRIFGVVFAFFFYQKMANVFSFQTTQSKANKRKVHTKYHTLKSEKISFCCVSFFYDFSSLVALCFRRLLCYVFISFLTACYFLFYFLLFFGSLVVSRFVFDRYWHFYDFAFTQWTRNEERKMPKYKKNIRKKKTYSNWREKRKQHN